MLSSIEQRPMCFCGSARVHTSCVGSAVAKAITAGLIVHAAHPGFGGWLTAGPSATAPSGFEAISHGGTFDVSCDAFDGTASLARYFVDQVGKWNAFVGVRAAQEKASA